MFRFVVLIAIAVGVLLVLMNTLFLTAARNMIFTSKRSMLQNQATVIASSLSAMNELDVEHVSQVMELLDVTELTGITVRGVNGNIYYDTVTPSVGAANIHDVRVLTALNGSTGFYGHFNGGVFKCYYYMPLVLSNRIEGVLVLYEADSEQGALLLSLQNSVRLVSIIVTAVFLAIAAVLIYVISARLRTIRRGIAPLGEGNYSHRISMKGRDEFSELGGAFDRLADRLEDNEDIRRRFVADASHELKTPIASIRLLSDSILQTDSIDSATTRDFVGDIAAEADRLANITQHLLTLTNLDNPTAISRTPNDLAETARQAVRTLVPLAEARGISLALDAPEPCFVLSAKDELYQIVQNLAENAVKYNVDGGSVTVSVLKREDDVLLTVRDTGIGIPAEDLPHIFERFYRVDKARSREAGGTGLGLSIVKDMVRILGGSVEVSSEPGRGTEFRILLPLVREDGESEEPSAAEQE